MLQFFTLEQTLGKIYGVGGQIWGCREVKSVT